MTFYSQKIASFVCLIYLLGGSSSWAADPTAAATVISEAGAQQVLSAAEHEAEALDTTSDPFRHAHRANLDRKH